MNVKLSKSNEEKYYLVASDCNQFLNIISNLGIKNKNYKGIAFEIYYYKKINTYKSENLKDFIQWCIDTDRDMKNVRYLY